VELSLLRAEVAVFLGIFAAWERTDLSAQSRGELLKSYAFLQIALEEDLEAQELLQLFDSEFVL
jgi:hypothetical protein